MSQDNEDTIIKHVLMDDSKRKEIVAELILDKLDSLLEGLRSQGNPLPVVEGAIIAISMFLDNSLVKNYDPDRYAAFRAAHPEVTDDYRELRMKAQASLAANMIEVTRGAAERIANGETDNEDAMLNPAAKKAAASALDELLAANRTIN